ncbi:UDP-N-acetylmuramate--L-alanine ligase [Parvularcula maris]|uniref:UDP-N-acetylmuramate--L-alanine ligase n=1 Tax=Parvularcula maris TaxID=2965077 RepID=A0A9X2RHP8_9PROT|nr:UDP-N-acetylmuramate--L-alanine ligase [Parvularcula maris]MCQ8185084.1 UDP-N-acetylmuramate--L-alanine ligase [Parvularcula maris]
MNDEELKVSLPFAVGRIHFVGIGGIGMSGIARVMHNLGYEVSGSDIAEGETVELLREKGIAVHIGHDREHVKGAAAVVVSTAIGKGNPEVAEARARHIPVVRRADMLAELMRLKWNVCIAGTHGKTTTTSMVAALMDTGGLDPTVINGGVINAYGTNHRSGEGDWMVVEADESDGTFVRLPTTVSVITNMDPEHLDHWGDFERLRSAFDQFIENTPFYGFGVVCLDHPEVQALVGRITDRRLVTYGLNPQADVRAENIRAEDGGQVFDIHFRERAKTVHRLEGCRLPMPGAHNVQNAVAAAIIARELGVPDEKIVEGFAKFGGVKRRFTEVGVWHGVRIIDDYGHHPVEINATLAAARGVTEGRVIAVIQPHRYTRLSNLFAEFTTCANEADTVLIAPVYEAGEEPIEGADAESLARGMTRAGHRDARVLAGFDELAEFVREETSEGDIVVMLGAGDVTKHAQALPGRLSADE